MRRSLAHLCRQQATRSSPLRPSFLIPNISVPRLQQQQQQQRRNKSSTIAQLGSRLSKNATGTSPVTAWDRLLDRVFRRKPETVDGPNRIGFSELKALVDSKQRSYILIDVREPEEFAEGHIPTAINIPCGNVYGDIRRTEYQFLVEHGNAKPSDAETFVTTSPRDITLDTGSADDEFGEEEEKPYGPPIYFYCLTGARARTAWGSAKSLGYERVKWYKGGYKEWCRFNAP